MKLAWLQDHASYIGGAELNAYELRVGAPEGVEIIDVAPTELEKARDCDAAVVFNHVTYGPDTIAAIETLPVVCRWADLAPHDDPDLKAWLLDRATNIFSSRAHLAHFDVGPSKLLPACGDLSPFRPTRQIRKHTEREGTVSIASWQNPGKGANLIERWAKENGQVRVYGPGEFAPYGLPYFGPLDASAVAMTLWSAERFLFLPTALEPFGRCVVEAWAAGCELIVNGLVGCIEWIKGNPEALDTAVEDFWSVVCG